MLRFCQDNILSCWNKFNNLPFAWSGFSWGLWSLSTELWYPRDLGWCSCVLSGYVFLPWLPLTWETFSFSQLKFFHLSRQPCCSESWATFSSDVNHLSFINNTFFFWTNPQYAQRSLAFAHFRWKAAIFPERIQDKCDTLYPPWRPSPKTWSQELAAIYNCPLSMSQVRGLKWYSPHKFFFNL